MLQRDGPSLRGLHNDGDPAAGGGGGDRGRAADQGGVRSAAGAGRPVRGADNGAVLRAKVEALAADKEAFQAMSMRQVWERISEQLGGQDMEPHKEKVRLVDEGMGWHFAPASR